MTSHIQIRNSTVDFLFKANGLMDEIRQNMRSDICER